jgi:autotransporter-associated beta strand protein
LPFPRLNRCRCHQTLAPSLPPLDTPDIFRLRLQQAPPAERVPWCFARKGTHFSAAPITGTGDLIQNGTGNLTLNAANTYTGATTINSGTLIASGGSAIADTGAVALANASGALFSVSGSETIGSLRGGGTAGGNVSIAAGQTLTVAETGNQAFSGSIQGSGALTKTGLGTLSLDGANTHSGPTTIDTGTLQLGGSLLNSAVHVGASGALGRPVANLGALNVASLSFSSGGSLLLAINGNATGQFDTLSSSGNITLNDHGVLVLNFGSLLAPGDSIALFTGTGVVAGNFSSISAQGSYSGNFNPSGSIWTLSSNPDLMFDNSTGVLSVVPEPSTWALLALTSALVLATHIRIKFRKKQTKNEISC